jgi:predicted ester cyclase
MDAVRWFVSLWRTGFPDIRYVIDESIAEGDKLACRVTLSGTHTGEFRHPVILVPARRWQDR